MKHYMVHFRKNNGGEFYAVSKTSTADEAVSDCFDYLKKCWGTHFTDCSFSEIVAEEISEEKYYRHMALRHAENIGVYAYEVRGHKMIYISYFGREGFYKVERNLDTNAEKRTHQASTKKEYNYFCG